MNTGNRPVYLDYNATTPHDPEVVEAMMPFLRTEFGNPSSSHVYGSEPRKAVARARDQVAALIGASAEEVVFTSGGTESNNYAILGAARVRSGRGRHIVTSNIEHPAVLVTCAALEQDGFEITRVPVDRHGVVDLHRLRGAIRDDTILVTVMTANNEIGTIEPIARIPEVAHEHGAWVHTDAAQAVGKVPVSVEELGVDMLTIAGHKLYAPKGVGALYLRGDVRPQLIMRGGSQERGLRPGTENVLEVVGLGAAAEVALRDAESVCRN
jgi:cysteine desulfurase